MNQKLVHPIRLLSEYYLNHCTLHRAIFLQISPFSICYSCRRDERYHIVHYADSIKYIHYLLQYASVALHSSQRIYVTSIEGDMEGA